MKATQNVGYRNQLYAKLCPELEVKDNKKSFLDLLVTRPDSEPQIITTFRRTVQGLLHGLDASRYPDLHEMLLQRSERVTNVLARFCRLPMRESRLSVIWSAGQASRELQEQVVILNATPKGGATVIVEEADDLLGGGRIFDYQGIGSLEVWVWELEVDASDYVEVIKAVQQEMWCEIRLPGVPCLANDDVKTA